MASHQESSEPHASTTVFRNPDGTTLFPSTIPPAVEFPAVGPPTDTALRSSFESSPHDTLQDHERAASYEEGRPQVRGNWQTERPQATSRATLARHLQRGGTNASVLNEALFLQQQQQQQQRQHGHDETASSSSSSDEDEEPQVKSDRRRAGTRHRRKEQPQPQDGNAYRRFHVGNDMFKTKGKVSKKDGRLNISVNEMDNSGYLAKALGASFLSNFGPSRDTQPEDHLQDADPELLSPHVTRNQRMMSNVSTASTVVDPPRPKLNIVVMVIGSRGDIQPFLRLGKILKEDYGHRVRIATHPAFREFVQKDSGLDFFSVGGNPAELMAFMVKNPGMIPKMETVRAGEIGRRRDQMAEMFEGFWRACINATDDEKNMNNLKMMGAKNPFVADAIIANPPCFAHIHCAERLGIPLHLMFTFPYTPTQAFPHPLANIKKTNVDPGYTNFMSYPLVEMMTWQGLGDLVNAFRVNTLGLEPVSTLWAPGQLYRLKVPYTYLWSPGLVPKPKDWGPEVDIAGFVFLDLASSFEPPKELTKFLEAGPPPIYIGFGSIVVDDPDRFTKMIFEAVKIAGVRALVSKGWGGLGDDNVPEGIYMLENTPHDWLFPKVKAVIHHGGAGTTAIGLKCGKPTMIVPFFGDQQFWGSMIGRAGAGAQPVPYKDLTTEKLADGIKQLLTEEAEREAGKIAKDIEEEGDGAQNAVKSFHRSLVLRGEHSMRCAILEDRVAVWQLKNTSLRLSALAADILVSQRKIKWKQLRLLRHKEWNDFEGPGEPVTGFSTALVGSLTSMATGIGSVPFRIAKSSKRRQRHEEKKRRHGTKHEDDAHGDAHGSDAKSGKQESGINGNGSSNAYRSAKEAAKHGESTSEKARAQKGDKATSGADLGKHGENGQPKDQQAEQKENQKDDDVDSVMSADPEQNAAAQIAEDVGHGFGKTGEAMARAPMDLTLAVAQGFHNAPRLYGDKTVRTPTRITGIHSGLRAAGEEFVYGIYDGFSGVVVQPYTGARDGGPVGFVKGVGMGLTGFVLKDIAAIIGPFGYTLKGVHKELLKSRQPTHFIRKARIIEGQRDLSAETEQQRQKDYATVSHGWGVVQQVWDHIYDRHEGGIRGRIRVMRERKTWHANGAFENVEMAEKALAARERGEPLELVFAQQRKEVAATQKPRKTALADMQEGKGGKKDMEKQRTTEGRRQEGQGHGYGDGDGVDEEEYDEEEYDDTPRAPMVGGAAVARAQM